MNYEDYVCGTKFQDLGNAQILDSGAVKMHTIGLRAEYPVLYCHTHQFNKSIKQISEFNDKIILITHNSDGCVRESRTEQLREYDADVNLLPSNVIRWYAQNVDLAEIPEKIVPIPIGLENRYCFDYDKAEMLFREAAKPVEKNHRIYVNFNISTNVVERTKALTAFSDPNICHVRLGTNGENYQQYLEELHTSSLVLCPPGNGLDCHRTWEALYLRSIPLMKHIHSIERMGIPTLFLHEWNEANESDKCAGNLAHYLVAGTLPKEIPQLSMNYWRERIKNAI